MKIIFSILLTVFASSTFAVTKEEVASKTSEAAQATVEYTREQKAEFQIEMEQKIKFLKKEIGELQQKASEKTGDAKKEMNESIKALKVRQEALSKDLSKLKKSSGNAWGEVKVGVSTAWDALSDSYKKAKDKFAE